MFSLFRASWDALAITLKTILRRLVLIACRALHGADGAYAPRSLAAKIAGNAR